MKETREESAVPPTLTPAQVRRALAAIAAAQIMSGTEPAPEDLEIGRRILTGETTAEGAIHARLRQLEQQHGLTRSEAAASHDQRTLDGQAPHQ
ncbi:hypothetical protein ACFOYW_17100 [Gryllotalpicola reticulitermitis]|uniref:Antitoxin VbhA domain-containing protein n=1 Tax=Gryllotalpicola reticulitermitis TaxID=1184153 RepID=A0ABV8QBP1_9MICO